VGDRLFHQRLPQRSPLSGTKAFDTVVLDPPYKLNGTSTGEGPAASDESYGVGGPYQSVEDKHTLIKDGIVECARICAALSAREVHGSGVLWPQILADPHLHPHRRARPGSSSWTCFTSRATGSNRKAAGKQHAWADYSTLLVLERES
jgi:hypothetical protein